jgi:hypothetical protein
MDETMSPTRSIAIASLLIALGAVPSIPGGPVAAELHLAQANPMEITTDTPAYCLHLLDRVSDLVRLAATPVPHDVTDLTTEGQRMCATGQTRGGIMRLRSALMMMERGNGTAYR